MRAPSRVAPPVPGTTPGTKAKINVTTPATSALIAVMVTPFFMADAVNSPEAKARSVRPAAVSVPLVKSP